MSKFSKLGRIAKVLGISASAGYISARVASSAHEASDNAKVGAIAGAATGALAASMPHLGKIVFRRIRGRIIPIKVK